MMGRPPLPKGQRKVMRSYYFPVDIIQALDRYPEGQRTKIVVESIRAYLSTENMDVYRLEREEGKAENLLNSIRSQLSTKRNYVKSQEELEQQQQKKHEKRIVEEYKACCDHIKTTYESAYLYSTKKAVQEFNEKCGTCFNIKQLESFVTSVKSGNECLDVFKNHLEAGE